MHFENFRGTYKQTNEKVSTYFTILTTIFENVLLYTVNKYFSETKAKIVYLIFKQELLLSIESEKCMFYGLKKEL